ncbi:MAG: hypothetical protein KJO69_00885, partial [Gammaproteobacteria bacterium]|nr:hypothetical protein [Gammaproteobacteria bacterium]NNJ73526.1 hypothetical protein [Enterobacterales bacterium]
MQKSNFLFTTLITASLLINLTGCGSDDNDTIELPEIPKLMVPTYAPSAGSIPVPNDILFLGTTDLTLNIPVADPENFGDPQVAINSLDGWSALAPFAINFHANDASLTLNPSSVVGGAGVHVFQVNTLRAEVAPGIPGPTGPVTSVIRELTPNLEYVVTPTSSSSIAIIPTTPFEQQAGYMVVLTNALTDSAGNPLQADFEYFSAKSPTPIPASSSLAALEPVRQLVNAMEAAADAG